jgi:hypothetical protein
MTCLIETLLHAARPIWLIETASHKGRYRRREWAGREKGTGAWNVRLGSGRGRAAIRHCIVYAKYVERGAEFWKRRAQPGGYKPLAVLMP